MKLYGETKGNWVTNYNKEHKSSKQTHKKRNILSTAEVLSCSRAERLEAEAALFRVWTTTSDGDPSHLMGELNKTLRFVAARVVRAGLQNTPGSEGEAAAEALQGRKDSSLAPANALDMAISGEREFPIPLTLNSDSGRRIWGVERGACGDQGRRVRFD